MKKDNHIYHSPFMYLPDTDLFVKLFYNSKEQNRDNILIKMDMGPKGPSTLDKVEIDRYLSIDTRIITSYFH